MRIWYQSYSKLGFDSRWDFYEPLLKRHMDKVARPDTEVTIRGLKLHPLKMIEYPYFQYLHIGPVIENALQAEREGYDAFVLVGMLDLGLREIRGIVDIPVVFSLETSLHVACLLARKYTLIAPNELVLRGAEELIKFYGFQERYVAGAWFSEAGYPFEFVEGIKKPKPLIEAFAEAARGVIKNGADILIPGSATTSGLLTDQGVREIDGVPILDVHGTLIKMAELMVDMRNVGIARSKKGLYFAPSKEELTETRKLFGVE